ncbi:MAG: ABC transporter ATP-binding protein [Chloroflexi bacterium]|nr:ABC transporter ATP-binding protein [Chloroflexota bacterium]
MLTVSRLAKSYGRLQAVQDVTLQVAPGQIVGLIGPNGSGKSTLLNCIAGTISPDAGRINFDGHDITGAPSDVVFRRGIARSHQDPALFQRMSVLDNTLLPARKQAGERARRAPFHRLWRAQETTLAGRAVGILHRLRLRDHYATRASDLSGGQMKLLELGRSLAGEPKLMLLDEPTAGVAPNLAYEIFEQIAALRNEGLTFLIVEHRLEILFDFVDHLFVMHLGSVLAQGSPAEIVANPQVKEVYFGA